MPLRPALAAVMAMAYVLPAAAAESFPYTAYITTDKVNVRSGPGVNYYATQYLDRGQQVEVWRHDPGGWFAIRPPAESFSWVSGDFLEPQRDGFAVIVGQSVFCRVGSVFGDARDVIQVRLDEGERVEVLEIHEVETDSIKQTWYKIAPPSGEFRWISGQYVSRSPDGPAPLAQNNVLVSGIGESAAQQGDVLLDRVGQASLGAETWNNTAGGEIAVVEPNGNPVTVRLGSMLGVDTELGQLEVELSRIVAEEPRSWEFTDLRRRVDGAITRAEQPEARDYGQRLLRKIDRYATIGRQWREVAGILGETDTLNSELNPAAAGTSSIAAAETTTDAKVSANPGHYDGRGRLSPVASREIGDPRFALIDERGEVTSYVTAAPGVNLQPYVGLEVGIAGTRGYLTRQQAPHLTARQIERIDGLRR